MTTETPKIAEHLNREDKANFISYLKQLPQYKFIVADSENHDSIDHVINEAYLFLNGRVTDAVCSMHGWKVCYEAERDKLNGLLQVLMTGNEQHLQEWMNKYAPKIDHDKPYPL